MYLYWCNNLGQGHTRDIFQLDLSRRQGKADIMRTHKTHSDCAIYQYFIFNTGLPLDFLEERAWNICPKYPAVPTVSSYQGSFSDNADQGVTTSAGSRIESQNLTPICGADKSCLW